MFQDLTFFSFHRQNRCTIFGNLKKTKVMKRLVHLGLIMITGLSFNTFAQESDSTGMPGDNFDLQGALNLFKQSKNLEDFERKLNTESNKVNNLDLDGNNQIDYIRVIDKKDGDNHAILLQIPVSKQENQDVAAIVIEKRNASEAQLQIIGNEVLYGEEKIMEPFNEREVKSTGPAADYAAPPAVIFVNVWGWPCVQYIYDPFYDPWFSPYYWDYYPSWWYPWRPVYYYVYYQRMYPYHGWCQYTTVYHVPHAHLIYQNNQSNSAYIRTRYAHQQAAYQARSVHNQSANGSKGRVETGKSAVQPKPQGRVEGQPVEVTRPTRNAEPSTLSREQSVPRPINSNTRGNIGNDGMNRDNNLRNQGTMEPARRNPSTAPQRQPIERSPQRVEPMPQRQTQPMRQSPEFRQQMPQRQPQPVRQAPLPRPGGGGRGR